jgi:hypothetical protein
MIQLQQVLKSPGESGLFTAGRDIDHSECWNFVMVVSKHGWVIENDIGFDGCYDFVHGYDVYIKNTMMLPILFLSRRIIRKEIRTG